MLRCEVVKTDVSSRPERVAQQQQQVATAAAAAAAAADLATTDTPRATLPLKNGAWNENIDPYLVYTINTRYH